MDGISYGVQARWIAFPIRKNKITPQRSGGRTTGSLRDSYINKKHHPKDGVFLWSRIRESNPPPRLGKPMYYRCTNPAYELFDRALRDIREYSGGKAASVPLRMHVSQGAVIVASRARKCNHYLSCAKKVSGGAALRRAFPVRFSPASPDRGTR